MYHVLFWVQLSDEVARESASSGLEFQWALNWARSTSDELGWAGLREEEVAEDELMLSSSLLCLPNFMLHSEHTLLSIFTSFNCTQRHRQWISLRHSHTLYMTLYKLLTFCSKQVTYSLAALNSLTTNDSRWRACFSSSDFCSRSFDSSAHCVLTVASSEMSSAFLLFFSFLVSLGRGDETGDSGSRLEFLSFLSPSELKLVCDLLRFLCFLLPFLPLCPTLLLLLWSSPPPAATGGVSCR